MFNILNELLDLLVEVDVRVILIGVVMVWCWCIVMSSNSIIENIFWSIMYVCSKLCLEVIRLCVLDL